jgi:mannosyl-oligosaccharide alpha-1,2-mannosidase
MGTGRTFQRPSSRLRLLTFWAAAAVLFLYFVLPHFGSDSSFLPHHHHAAGKPQVQFPFKQHGARAGNPERAEAVKKAMKRTFWKYREAAWGMDEVRPISGGNRTSRNGWAATLVDTLTTTLMMGLEEEFTLVRRVLGGGGVRADKGG